MAARTSIFGVLYIISNISAALTLRCIKCTDVVNPFSCGTVTECASGEQCFIQESVTPKGEITYSLGCRPSQQCQYKRRGVGDIAVCHHCCHSDYCNAGGCGVSVPTLTNRGPKCFNCSSNSPEGCTTTQMCATDQECGLIQSGQTWTGSCLPKPQCAVIESIQVQASCHICCSGDYCNDRCHPLGSPAATNAAQSTFNVTTVPMVTATSHTTTTMPLTTTAIATAWSATAVSTTQGTCVDQPVCADQDLSYLLCREPTLGAQECPNKCGFCGTDCIDVLNCTGQGARSFFCADKTMAVKYCRKSCGKCGETAIPVTLNSCGDPVELTRCEFLHENLCMCNDPAIRELCKNFCAGRCPKRPADNDQCQGVTSIIGKRSEILQHLIEDHN